MFVKTTQLKSVFDELQAQLRKCPRCLYRSILQDVLVQKREWGGKQGPDNQAQLCAPCDQDWRVYVEENDLTVALLPELREAFGRFIAREVGPEPALSRELTALKEIGGIRVRMAGEKVRVEGRLRSVGNRLEEALPLARTRKMAQIAPEAENWTDLLLGNVAELKTLKDSCDKELASLLPHFPIWTHYLKHVPGIGPYLGGYLIGTIGSVKNPTNDRQGVRAFPDTGHLWGFAGLGIDMTTNRAEGRKRGEKLGYNPLLKIALVQLVPQSFQYQKTRFPESPYSKLLYSVHASETEKATLANPQKCGVIGCEETDVANLGWKCQNMQCKFTAEFADRELARAHDAQALEGHRTAFAGYCCRKSLEVQKRHLFLHPAHIQRRVMRTVGKKFLADFYHAWLWLEGENPDISQNPRIAAIFEKAREAATK